MPKLTRIREVEFYRYLWPSRRLTDISEAERFAKRSAAVTELYSHHLTAGPPLLAQTWWVRFILDPELASWSPYPVAMTVDLGLGEVHEVPFDRSLADITDDHDRRLATLEHLHGLLLRLADVLGWDRAPLDLAREACLQDDLRLVLTGPPKSSPDRRHKAFVVYTIDGEGDGWSRVHVVDRGGPATPVGEPLESPDRRRCFRAIARSLRWQGNSELSLVSWPDDAPGLAPSGPQVVSLGD